MNQPVKISLAVDRRPHKAPELCSMVKFRLGSGFKGEWHRPEINKMMTVEREVR